jgi:hypothetical protein
LKTTLTRVLLGFFVVSGFIIISVVGGIAEPGKTAANKALSLPGDLFVSASPGNAVEVIEARRSARDGEPIVVKGRIGGLTAPFAEQYAIFILSDLSFAACADGCGNLCSVPRDQVIAGLATVQVADEKGNPLKVPIKGVNGLQPMSEVTVVGKVAKANSKLLIINAKNIFVANSAPAKP